MLILKFKPCKLLVAANYFNIIQLSYMNKIYHLQGTIKLKINTTQKSSVAYTT